jgi:hypothetical protein
MSSMTSPARPCFTKGLNSITVLLYYMVDKEVLTMRGNRALWMRFVYTVKQDRKQVWQTLAPLLQQYIKQSTKKD